MTSATISHEQAEDLSRVRSRLSAYVYGNVLVLAAVVQNDPTAIRDGHAVVVVAATALTTYLAHVLAHQVGESLGRSAQARQLHLRSELRDAVPILTSGALPSLVLALVALGWAEGIGTGLVQLVAASVVVVRLALTGWVANRTTGATTRRLVWSAVGLAAVGLGISVVKVVLTH